MHGHIHKELLFHLESKMTGSVWQFEWQQDINVELSMSKLGLCQIVVSLCHFYSSFRSQHKNYYQFTMFLNSSFLFHPFSVDINIVGESIQIQVKNTICLLLISLRVNEYAAAVLGN